MNINYGKLEKGRIQYAPSTLEVDGTVKVNPSAASYLAAGWKKVVDEPPVPDAADKEAQPSGWTETDTTLVRVYKIVARKDAAGDGGSEGGTPSGGGGSEGGSQTNVPGHRIFSKLKVVAALKEADKWVLVKTWMEEKAYYDYYVAAQNFAEDNPLFAEALDAVKRYTGMSDEAVEAILSNCIYEE